MAQRQRLAEEQIRRQWEEWQARQAKQQKKQDVITQERWNQQRKVNEDLGKQISAISPVLEMHQKQLETLWEVRRNDATTMLKSAQDVYDTQIAPIEEQLTILRAGRKE